MSPTQRLIFRVHALERMFERRITAEDVRAVVADGEVIQSYPEDKPYPSRLVLGWRGTGRYTWSLPKTAKTVY